jgi:hypothetical protein
LEGLNEYELSLLTIKCAVVSCEDED